MEKWYPHILRILDHNGPLESRQIYCYMRNNFFWGNPEIKLKTLRRYLGLMQKEGLVEYVEKQEKWYPIINTKKRRNKTCKKCYWSTILIVAAILASLTLIKLLS